MGFLSKIAAFFGLKKKEANVLVVGLDNSGKTCILNKLKDEDTTSTDVVPTVGFNVERIEKKGLKITAFDMSGQGRYRNMWEAYYRDCNGIIFVVDSSDKLRLAVAKEELENLLNHKDIQKRRVPILFYANKMDIREAASSVKVSQLMGLDKITNKPWHICASNGLTGEGLHEGATWLIEQMEPLISSSK